MEKENLIDSIKDWIQMDNEMKELQKALKERRSKKKELTDSLVNVMKANDIDCFDTKDSKLLYKQNKVKCAMSKTYLLQSIQKLFQNDPVKAKEVSEYLLNNREEKIKETITRKLIK